MASKENREWGSAADSCPPTAVSVLLSVHNSATYLREAIESILSQTFPDFEFLIINDGSTDSSQSIAASFRDPRIRIIDNPSCVGLARSLNRGLQLATGKFVARQDADDVSEPKRLERQVAFLTANPDVALVGCSCTEIDDHGNVLRLIRLPTDPVELKWGLYYYCPFYHTAVMFRRLSVLKHIGCYNEKFRYSMDFELWRRIAQCFSVGSLDEPLVRYRCHDDSMTATFGDSVNEGFRLRLAVVSELLGWNPRDSSENQNRFRRMCGLLLGDFETLTPSEAAKASEDLRRLHEACPRSGIGEADWLAHREKVTRLLQSRLVDLHRRWSAANADHPRCFGDAC